MQQFLSIFYSLSFSHLDLLGVGLTVAAIALLGIVVYISNTKSISNIAFLFFCVVTILWSVSNYLSYQTSDPSAALFFLRLVIFFAFWHSFTFFNFLYVFPRERGSFPVWHKYFLTPYIIVVSLWTLFGDFVFSGIKENSLQGAHDPVVENGMILFVLTALSLIVASFVFLIKKIRHAKTKERTPLLIILGGALLTFSLIVVCNLILPSVFKVTIFIPLGAIIFFPFSFATAYSIFKHRMFRVTNIGSAVMAFLLCGATFVEIIFAENIGQLVLRSGIFLFVLLISIQFVKNIFVLEATTRSLETANEQLKSLDKLKSEFISLASHQLRSPLTVIKGYASTLTDGVVGEMNTKQHEITRHIYTSAQGLASLVEDFLNVTKIEQGGMKYIFDSVDIKKIVDDISSDMKLVAEDKHLEFVVSCEVGDSCLVKADAVKLKQVFLNLIDNSIKYTKEGFVKVSLKKEDSMLVFSVTDSGVGLTDETKKKLFTKFGRGNASVLNTGGSGLGLYLAYEIVKAHKGEIIATSEGVGTGSTFSVTIPLVQ